MRRLSLPAVFAVLLLSAAAAPHAQARDSALEKMESAIVKLAEQTTPSVVGIDIRKAKLKDPAAKPDTVEFHEQRQRLRNAGGSGFAIDAEHVVTAARAVPDSVTELGVILPDGRLRDAQIVGRSDAYNVVLLKVEGGGLPALKPATNRPHTGEFVMSVGNSFAVTNRMWRNAYSIGVISGVYEVKKGFQAYYGAEVLETDAAVNPGNFGGPLVNRRGEVVGMTVSSFTHRRWLGTAIPIDVVLRVVAQIRGESEPASRVVIQLPAMGVVLQPAAEGLTVVRVQEGSLAASLGWKAGDRIVSLDGESPSHEAAEVKPAFAAGAKVRLVLDKDGWKVEFAFQMPTEGGAEDSGESEF